MKDRFNLNININPTFFSIISASIIFCLYVVLTEPVLSKDSFTYSRWADILLKHDFNYKNYFNDVNFVVPPYFYSGFVSLLALTKTIFGENWQQGIVFINLITYIAIAGLISHLVFRATNNNIAAILSSLLFIFCAECLIWIKYVLSDATFLFLTVISSYLFLLAQNSRSKKLLFSSVLMLFILASYRPTAFPIITVIVLCYLLFQLNLSSQLIRSVVTKYSLSIFLFILIVSILIMAYLMQDINRWPVNFAKDYLNLISDLYKQGNIIDDRPETFVSSPETYIDYIKFILIRFYYFFVFSIEAYSIRHSILNYLIFLPSYFFGILGAFEILSSKSKINEETWKLGILCLFIILSTFVFVSFLLIDYDWRYRLVIMPYIFILAGIGFNRVIK